MWTTHTLRSVEWEWDVEPSQAHTRNNALCVAHRECADERTKKKKKKKEKETASKNSIWRQVNSFAYFSHTYLHVKWDSVLCSHSTSTCTHITHRLRKLFTQTYARHNAQRSHRIYARDGWMVGWTRWSLCYSMFSVEFSVANCWRCFVWMQELKLVFCDAVCIELSALYTQTHAFTFTSPLPFRFCRSTFEGEAIESWPRIKTKKTTKK